MLVGDAGCGGGERPPQWADPQRHREGLPDPVTDKEILDGLEIEADERDRDEVECRWGQSYGDTDTQTWEKHRGRETRSFSELLEVPTAH